MYTYIFEESGKTVHVMKAETIYKAKVKLGKALGLPGKIFWNHQYQKIRVVDTKYVGVRVISDKTETEING